MRHCTAPITALQWLVYELPKLQAEHRPLIFMLQPGEALFIPDSWQHLTLNIDDAAWAYMSSCDDAPDNLPTAEAGRAIARNLCESAGRFCEGFCGHWCSSCEGRNCTCS